MKEKIAEKAHLVWQRWMGYMLAHLDDEHLKRWTRQANTAYKDLPESERESDRHIAIGYISLLKEEIKKVENPYPATRQCADEDGAIQAYENVAHTRVEEFRQAILKALES